MSCGLSATVSSGDDIGFYVKTQTRYCSKCETLIDVCVDLRCKDMLPDLMPEEQADEMLKLENKYGFCQNCELLTEIVWRSGDPCPRCGGTVEKTDDELVDWD